MPAFYNEIDPYCAQWLRNLIEAGRIPPGDVDERPIEKVSAHELYGYTQAHFFAGIGGWPLAARLAGWPDDAELWTGSCPCQPYSNAGRRLADDDPRNLWPELRRLIAERKPAVAIGEQVTSPAGRLWLAGVRTDLEALGYAVGAADLCAAGIGAPHIRQRLWWVADAQRGASERHGFEVDAAPRGMQEASRQQRIRDDARHGSAVRGLGHAVEPGLEGHAGYGADGNEPGRQPENSPRSVATTGGDCGMEQPDSEGRSPRGLHLRPGRPLEAEVHQQGPSSGGIPDAERPRLQGSPRSRSDGERELRGLAPEDSGNPWNGAVWIPCADGKARRIEPGIEPLVDGFPGRVEQVRAYGNAIPPHLAAEFLIAYIEAREN